MGEEDTVDTLFGLMKTKFVDNGIPVIIGEFGAIKRNLSGANLTQHLASRTHYYKYCTQVASNNGMILMCWDAGYPYAPNTMGLFDRNTGNVVDSDVVNAIMDGFPSVCPSLPHRFTGCQMVRRLGLDRRHVFPVDLQL
jgi:hypothetical protein